MNIKEVLKNFIEANAPKYKIVNVEELADFIFEMEVGDEVYFAETWDEETPPEKLDGSCCESWYGIKIISAFDSMMAIFNYAGGGKAFAAELDGDTIEQDIQYYFNNFVNRTTRVVLEY